MKDSKQGNDRTELLKQLETAEGIQEVLNIALKLIGNPMVLSDLTYRLLAYTENTIKDDPIWEEFMALGKLSHQTVNFFKNENFIAAYFASPVALMQSSKLKYDRANAIVYDKDGLQLCNLTAVACYKPFEENDFKRMEIVCNCLAKEIQKNPDIKIPTVFEENAYRKLIEYPDAGLNLSKNEIMQLHKVFKAYIYVVVVDTIKYENTLTHLVYFKELFQSFNNDYQCFIYLNNIVILFSSDKPVLNTEIELGKFNTFFKENSIFAGVSGGFHSLINLKTYFKEALNALNYGMCLDSGKNIFSFDIFRVELFVNSFSEEVDIVRLCHPILFAVRKYDNENNTEYTEILYNYFICSLDRRRAAERMNISYSDFDSYLSAAAKIFQIDLSDGNLLFSLFRSIKLLKCFPEKFDLRESVF